MRNRITCPVEGSRFVVDAGLVNPVRVWVDVNGKRQLSNDQATDESGVPLWEIGIKWVGTEFGRMVEQSAEVQVAQVGEPQVKRNRPIHFKNLTVTVSARLQNGKAVLSERYTADGFTQAPNGPVGAKLGDSNA